MFNRVFLVILDGVGAGALPDAHRYGDEGANTLLSVLDAQNPRLPTLYSMGLGRIVPGYEKRADRVRGAYGRMVEVAPGKDTTTGHWEIAGLTLAYPFPVYPDGFPQELIDRFARETGRGVLGNIPASGTQILLDLGREHVDTGKLIVYTSADSVFQIAAHEDIVAPELLYEYCRKARAMLVPPHQVGRVIARPFAGEYPDYVRTGNRRDFSIEPTGPTMLDVLKEAGRDVLGIGKIEDIFAHRGLTLADHASGNRACIESMLRHGDTGFQGLMFVNLVDTDSVYGHRNDLEGFARALEEIDRGVADLKAKMRPDDLLILAADHGCDPGFAGTDHTREHAPLLCWHVGMDREVNLYTRETFADVAATVLDNFGLKNRLGGTSFLSDIL